MTNTVHSMIIIGSGPAGHTAAIYAGRAMLSPLMFEGFLAGGVAAGGQLTTTTDVENFPGFPQGIQGPKLMEDMRKQSLASGATIHTQTVDSVDLSTTPYRVYVGEQEYRTHTIVLATGATAKRLHLPGEKEYWQKGISACAVCDGALPLFRDKPLVVVGGGDSACEEALFLTKYASEVHMLVRRDVMRASKVMAQRAQEHQKITVHWNTEAQEIQGDGSVMTGVRIKNNESEKESVLKASGLFYAIGHIPNTGFLENQVLLDEQGYIQTKPGTVEVRDPATQKTIPGVYAAGDVQDKHYRQAITSAGTGCMAALDAEQYLQAHKLI